MPGNPISTEELGNEADVEKQKSCIISFQTPDYISFMRGLSSPGVRSVLVFSKAEVLRPKMSFLKVVLADPEGQVVTDRP